MSKRIRIKIDDLSLEAELNDDPNADALWEKLPLTVRMSRWGDEYYGNCGLTVRESPESRTVMEIGELALWPPGSALCIFFGATPASTDERPRAASAVVPIGRLVDDPSPLKNLGGSVQITVEKV